MYNIPLAEFEDVESITDWVELMITINQNSMSKSQMNSAIEMSSGEEPPETLADDVWVELERRKLLYGDVPPYELEPRSVSFSLDYKRNPEYVVCLFLSIIGNAREPGPSGKLFERLSSEAISQYLKGETLLFGYPSQKKVVDITKILHETLIRELPHSDNDGGLDVVGWIPFKDQRPSQVVMLFQCAAGKNWESKLTQLSLQYWGSMISWKAPPCRGFTAPVIISDRDFDKKAYHGGVLLDRARIYKNTFSKTFQGNLKAELLTWVDNTISELTS